MYGSGYDKVSFNYHGGLDSGDVYITVSNDPAYLEGDLAKIFTHLTEYGALSAGLSRLLGQE